MSWQSKALGLVKKYGEPTKFAASTILGVVLPGSPAIITLVEKALDSAKKTAQDDWEIDLSNQLEVSNENQKRLEQMLDVLGGDLQYLFAQVANFQRMPEIALKLVQDPKRVMIDFSTPSPNLMASQAGLTTWRV